jgi:hypothetical protein
VLRRLAYQQGGTSLADHFRRLKRALADASDELAAKTAEADSQLLQLQQLRARLETEAARHRQASARVNSLARELQVAQDAAQRAEAASQRHRQEAAAAHAAVVAASPASGKTPADAPAEALPAAAANLANDATEAAATTVATEAAATKARRRSAEANLPAGVAAAVAAADAVLRQPVRSAASGPGGSATPPRSPVAAADSDGRGGNGSGGSSSSSGSSRGSSSGNNGNIGRGGGRLDANRSAPRAPAPWRDPFGGDYAATPATEQRADGSNISNPRESDSSWWPFQSKPPQKVGGRLVMQV